MISPVASAQALSGTLAGRSWVAGGLGGGSMTALDATMRPIDALAAANLDWLTDKVQPLQTVLDNLAGSSSAIQSFADATQRTADTVNQVQQQVAGQAAAGDWQGSAADNYRAEATQIATGLQATAQLYAATGTLTTALGGVVADARTQVNTLVTNLVQQLISYVQQSNAANGALTPDTVSNATTMINEYAPKIADVEQKLQQTLANVAPLITGSGSGVQIGDGASTAHVIPAFFDPASVAAEATLLALLEALVIYLMNKQKRPDPPPPPAPPKAPPTGTPPATAPPTGTPDKDTDKPPEPGTLPQSAPPTGTPPSQQPGTDPQSAPTPGTPPQTVPPTGTPPQTDPQAVPPSTPQSTPAQTPPQDSPKMADEPANEPTPDKPAPDQGSPDRPLTDAEQEEQFKQHEDAVQQQEAGQAQPERVPGPQGWPTPQAALGKEGTNKEFTLVKDDKATEADFIKYGYTRKLYMLDQDGTQYSFHYRPATDEYTYGKSSSTEDPEWDPGP